MTQVTFASFLKDHLQRNSSLYVKIAENMKLFIICGRSLVFIFLQRSVLSL